MRSCVANFAILLVVYSSLVQSKLLQTIGTPFRVASAIGGGLRKLILPDVSLPTDKSLYEAKDLLTNIVDLNGLSTYDAVKFAMKGGASIYRLFSNFYVMLTKTTSRVFCIFESEWKIKV